VAGRRPASAIGTSDRISKDSFKDWQQDMNGFSGGSPNPFGDKNTPPGLNDPAGQGLQSEFAKTYGTGIEAPRAVSPAMKRRMQQVFLIVLAAGLVVGVAVASVAVIAIQKAGLLDVPTYRPTQSQPASP